MIYFNISLCYGGTDFITLSICKRNIRCIGCMCLTEPNRPICATWAALQWVSAQGQAGWCPLGPAGAQSCSSKCPPWPWQTVRRPPLHPANAPQEAEHQDLGWLLPLRRGGRWQLGRAQLWVCVSITPSKAQGEIERRSDRSFVKAPFICESGLDVSHHQHVGDGCLSSFGNGNLGFRFQFRNERKESNWKSIATKILPSLKVISTSHFISCLKLPVGLW